MDISDYETLEVFSFPFNQESTLNATGIIELDRNFLRAQEHYLNDLMRVQGFVFLNDVLHHLGFKKISSGQLLGWMNMPISFNIDYRSIELPEKLIVELHPEGIIFDKI